MKLHFYSGWHIAEANLYGKIYKDSVYFPLTKYYRETKVSLDFNLMSSSDTAMSWDYDGYIGICPPG